MEVHKVENGVVKFIEEIPSIVWKANGYMKSEDFRKLTMKGVEAFAKNKVEYSNICWLNDVRKMKVISRDDQKWLTTAINDEVEKHGLRKLAFVLPENVFAKLAIKLYIESAIRRHKDKLEIKSFNTYEKAAGWLKIVAKESL